MPILWTEDLATNVFAIDTQHKELFNIINDLLDAAKRGEAKNKIMKVVDFLEDYVREHFSMEETLMTEKAYPHIAAHKKQHEEFKKSVSDFKSKVMEEGVTLSITISITHVLVEWLTKHIRQVDKEMAKHLRGEKH